MGLHRSEWLHVAKGISIGSSTRVPHAGDRTNRPNLIIHNRNDRWEAYCQSCKVGDRVLKEHVQWTAVPAPRESTRLDLPADRRIMELCTPAERRQVMTFLASKNMDGIMLPAVQFSASRQRLLVNSGGDTWLGRDLTNMSMQKWITYNGQHYLRHSYLDELAPLDVVVVEDPFSYYKIIWATAGRTEVVCSLGTGLNSHSLGALLEYKRVLFFYDGDAAGRTGAAVNARRLRAFGIPAMEDCAPEGMDPKDMNSTAIINHIRTAFER